MPAIGNRNVEIVIMMSYVIFCVSRYVTYHRIKIWLVACLLGGWVDVWMDGWMDG